MTGRGAKKDFADIVAIFEIWELPVLLGQFQIKFSDADKKGYSDGCK